MEMIRIRPRWPFLNLHGHNVAPGPLEQVQDLGLPQRLGDGDRRLAVAVDGVGLTAGVDE